MTTISEVRVTLDGMRVDDTRVVPTDNAHSTRTIIAKEAKARGWIVTTRRMPVTGDLKVLRIS